MKLFLSFIFFLSLLSSFAQYNFDSKKEKKLYYKLEEAYTDYDYNYFIENEEEIKEAFLDKEDTVAANTYSFLAEAYYWELEELQQALDYYNSEFDLRKKIQPDENSISLIFSIANINRELGYYKIAEELFIQVVKAEEERAGKKDVEYFTAAMGLGDFYIETERPKKGLEVLNDLRKHVTKNTIDEVVVLKSIGDCHAIEGSFRKANNLFIDALDVVEKNGLENSMEYVSVLNSLGILYTDRGKLPEAEEILEEALDIIEKIPGENDDWKIGIISNLSRVYFNYGEYDKAEAMQVQVAKDDKDYYGENSFNYGSSLVNLGRSYTLNEKFQEANEAFIKAEKIIKDNNGENSLTYADILRLQSDLFSKNGFINKSIELGEKSYELHLSTVGKNHFRTSFPLYSLANSYMNIGYLEKAEKVALEALNIRKRKYGKKHMQYAKSTNQMAILEWKKGNKVGAIQYYRETFDNYFDQINAFFPVLTEEEKAKFYYANVKPAFEQYISFVMHIEDDEELKGELLGELYDYQLSLKGLILYATQRVRESIYGSGDEGLIAKYDEWISEKEQLAKLFSANDMDVVKRNKKIDSLTVSSNKLEEELAIASKTFGESFANKDLKWQDVRDQLKPGEAAIEMIRYKNFSPDSAGYFTDEVDYSALIIKSDTEKYPEAVNIDKGRTMESKYLANYRNAIRYRIKENYSYKLFWEPIAQALKGIKKVYFSPDGVYNQVSIYTFRNPDTNEYLVEEFDLQVVTNTKDLIVAERDEDNLQGVFFGYPNYNMGALDEITVAEGGEVRGLRGLSGGERGVGTRGGSTRGGTRGTRSVTRGSLRGKTVPRGIRGNLVRYMRAFNEMALLPGTLREVQNIDSLYQKEGLEAVTYYANEAVEKQIKEVKSPSTLHIATHGFFLELDPDDVTADTYVQNPLLRSGLILAGANSFILTGELADSDNDGILTAYEAMNLDLSNTDVVVLSACETGLGEIRNGEGVYGLQRAFKIAGAEAIIMSMWSVDDNATQELMNNFYEEWVKGSSKGDAFIAAQKRLKEKYPDPFFWGAFVLVGN